MANKPFACHVMAKPSGAICNMECTYCFYLEKVKLYPHTAENWRMDDRTLELYVSQYIEANDMPEVSFAWQGGEPTLMGVNFYRRALQLQEKYANGKRITNAFQTNGLLLDDEWGEFLADHGFLVGLSVDGPRRLHDQYRVDRGGHPTFDRVMSGLEVLKRHGVEFNTLTVLNSTNADHPLEVYRFLKSIGSRFMQFIPLVERSADRIADDDPKLVGPHFGGSSSVAHWSVSPAQYGDFLCAIFNEWVRQDVGRYFVQIFDIALAAWVGQKPSLCVFAETCGDALVIEHNGDLYSCDHFVHPEYRLGNAHEESIRELATSPRQVHFGLAKRDRLPQLCRQCEFRRACNGGCPKHRFTATEDGEEGLNYLCAGYKAFFSHVDPYMQVMARELRNGRPAANVIPWARSLGPSATSPRGATPGRNDPCACGSGRKYKRCCGRS